MSPEHCLLVFLRFERSLFAATEVGNYGCIADVLAVDKNKKRIIEYEFKRSSQDLKVNEKNKYKYKLHNELIHKYGRFFWINNQKVPNPHQFYYVIPEKLWEKEKDYLKDQKGKGVIVFYEKDNYYRDYLKYNFVIEKRATVQKKNLQKYEVVVDNILSRATSAYAGLLKK